MTAARNYFPAVGSNTAKRHFVVTLNALPHPLGVHSTRAGAVRHLAELRRHGVGCHLLKAAP